MSNAEIFVATNEEYHASEGWSNSKLSDFIESPMLAYHYHVAKDWEKPPPTPEMEFGTRMHDMLPPADIADFMVKIPAEALNADGHRKGAAWKEFEKQHAGKVLYKDEAECEAYLHLWNNASKHENAWLLGEADHVELNVRWIDDDTGLLIRARLDRLHLARAVIVDAKTTKAKDEREFCNSIANFGYHRQEFIYRWAVRELYGENVPFVFCALPKSRPYAVRFYDLNEEWQRRGEHEVRTELRKLRRCLDTNEWQPEAHREIVTLSPPRYLSYQEAWTL